MIFHVQHTTEYEYAEPVSVSHHTMHLKPRDDARQRLLCYRLEVTPTPAVTTNRVDYFNNVESFCTLQEPHKKLTIAATSEIELSAPTWPAPEQTPAWENVSDEVEPIQFVVDSPMVRSSLRYADYAR